MCTPSSKSTYEQLTGKLGALIWHDQTCRTVKVISIAAAKEERTTGVARRGVIVYNYAVRVTSLDQKFPANGL